jgi:hypothetical protein
VRRPDLNRGRIEQTTDLMVEAKIIQVPAQAVEHVSVNPSIENGFSGSA